MTGLDVTVAVLLALGLDWMYREPPAAYHPVTLFGHVVDRLECREYNSPKVAGIAVAIGLPFGSALLTYATLWVTTVLPGIVTAVLAGLVLWSTSSLRLLLDVAEKIIENSDTAPETAREALPALVGRDATDLSPELIRSAAVESLAENLSDGLVAPLFAFGVLASVSLPAAAAGATFVKAVNTMDSMLGYPGDFGFGSARLDDIVMFVPARITALLFGITTGDPDAPLRARRYAKNTASPNAGWPMGAVAAGLNVRLEKPGNYVLNDVADYPTIERGYDALHATRRAGIGSYGALAVFGVILWV